MALLLLQIVFSLCILLPGLLSPLRKLRFVLLLVANFLFYYLIAGSHLIFLASAILISFVTGKIVDNSSNPTYRKICVLLAIFFYVGLFGYFRHYGSTPPGFSFYALTTIAYVLDIYRKRIAPEDNFVPFAASVSLVPNITAGPIERSDHLLPQLRSVNLLSEKGFYGGLSLILWGLFEKFVIANRLAQAVDLVYSDPQSFGSTASVIGTLFFSIQIYADFCGYSDIAIGLGRMLGIDLFENFRRPYFAHSILEFWRRWHMSLTNWLRAYVFLPYSRFLLGKTNRNHARFIEFSGYLLLMSLVGLWHGFDLTFLAWGFVNGVYMIVETLIPGRMRRVKSRRRPVLIVNIVITFILITISWILFRAESISDAAYIAGSIFYWKDRSLSLGFQILNDYDWVVVTGAILVLFGKDYVTEKGISRFDLTNKPFWWRLALNYGLASCILIFGNFGLVEFIYARF